MPDDELRDAVHAAMTDAVRLREDLDATVDRITAAVAEHVGSASRRREAASLAPVVPLRPRKLDPDEPCPGCGALPQRGRNGVARLHGETCDYVASIAPQLRPSN